MTDDLLTGTRHRELTEFDEPPSDPVALLGRWLDEAVAGDDVELPHAMVLATVGPDGAPATRTVAVKRWDGRGLVFGSHRPSRKGRDLARDARAAGTFHWRETLQQINLAGRVEVTSDAESDELFLERPEPARASAIVSRQSEPLDDEAALRAAADAALAAGQAAVRPSTWAGYLFTLDRIEFWHGGHDRLHRRLEYRRLDDGSWSAQRLQP